MRITKSAEFAEIVTQGGEKKIAATALREACFFFDRGLRDISFSDAFRFIRQAVNVGLLLDSPVTTCVVAAKVDGAGMNLHGPD